jgi:hypothetical protein
VKQGVEQGGTPVKSSPTEATSCANRKAAERSQMNGEPVKEHPSSLVPHHEVGISPGMEVREVEYRPAETRSCRGSAVCEYNRSLLKALYNA